MRTIIKILRIKINIHIMKRIYWRKSLYVYRYLGYTDYAWGPFYMNIDNIN
jgi:hypothetical protein